MIDQLVQDVRVGARMLVKAPVFTIFSTLVLSIGIGANVVVFTYLNAIFLELPDVPEPHRLVRIYTDAVGSTGTLFDETYRAYRERNQAFLEFGRYSGGRAVPIRTEGPGGLPLEIVRPTRISGGLFKVVGSRTILGRGIEYEDDKVGSPDVVVLLFLANRRGRSTLDTTPMSLVEDSFSTRRLIPSSGSFRVRFRVPSKSFE